MIRHLRTLRALVAAFIILSLAGAAAASPPPRYLLLHIDAVAGVDFDAALAAGSLPNVARAFADGSTVRALTLFPASTPVIYPRMHTGCANDGPGAVGFGGFDRACNRPIAELDGFAAMLGQLPRRAVSNLLHGVPGLDGLGALAMRNLPDLLDRYRVVEFFWFSTDAYGHLEGREAHLRSLERFDAALGEVWPRLDLDGLNVILYADHGMSFADSAIDIAPILHERVGDRLRHEKYPNVYLHDPAAAPAVAFDLTRPGGLDYALYRVDGCRAHGYVDGGFVRFEAEGEGIRYLADGDPLGYAALGYGGEALSDDVWLAMTHDARYPAAPPNLFRYLQHPGAGDVAAGLNPPRFPWTPRVLHGNHAGFVDTDLMVSVWVRGPDVAAIAERDVVWLHTLYRDLPDLDFGVEPSRERHTFEVRLRTDDLSPSVELRLSPTYRWRLGAEVDPDRLQLWSEHDLPSTYLVRWWVGVGVVLEGGTVGPVTRAELEIDVGDLRLSALGCVEATGWTVRLRAGVRLTDGLRVSWSSPGSVGIGVEW
ncbi:MAG: alkaline phosphatase family protein [bacterium]|nr:alkaline phosphatase family protein [bacterium]